jgi:hypothetical protein
MSLSESIAVTESALLGEMAPVNPPLQNALLVKPCLLVVR